MEFLENCQFLETNHIIITDYRAYLIEVNLSEYFSKTFSKWDQINNRMLNPSRRSHWKKFAEELEELLQRYYIEDMLDRVSYELVIREELELIDEAITSVLIKATKKVQGLSRNIPYSKMKEIKQAQLLH